MSKGDTASPTAETLKVFVSYSRTDQEFVDQLHDSLTPLGIEAFIDRSDIEKFVDWRARIEQLIGAADTVVFVLSPASLTSDSCAREIKIGVDLHKRFAPIVARALGDAPVAEPICSLNYIFFDGRDYDASLKELVTALQADVEWIREHTRLGELGRRWDRSGRPPDQLLRRAEADRAYHWLASTPRNAPEPTEVHRQFINASVEQRGRIRHSEWEGVSARSEKIELLIRQSQLRQARDVLDEAITYCSHLTEDELIARRGDFEDRRHRIDRFVRFYERAREVYIFAGEEEFDQARTACEDALQAIDALDRRKWWQELASEDLAPEDVDKLKYEAHRQLMLLSALRLQPGIRKISPKTKPTFDLTKILLFLPGSAMRAFAKAGGLSLLPALRKQDNREAASDFAAALATLDRVHEFEVAHAVRAGKPFPLSRSSRMLRQIGELLLNHSSGPKGEKIEYRQLLHGIPSPVFEKLELLNPADFYFLGLFNFFVAKRQESPFAKILTLFQAAFPDIDTATPYDTAERLLRAGVSREAHNFWPHFVLGRTLLSRGDYRGAELAFNVCISIDPAYARGFEQRALSLAGQWREKPYEDFRQRAEEDSQRALELAAEDPATYWPRGELLETLGRMREAINTYARWMELEHDLLGRMSRGTGLKKAHDLAERLAKSASEPDQQALRADCFALLALANWLWGRFEEAQQFVGRVLTIDDGHARARTVNGLLLRKDGELDGAVAEFEAAIGHDSADYLARFQRAETYEEKGDRGRALAAWDDLNKASDRVHKLPAWMRLAAADARKRLEAT